MKRLSLLVLLVVTGCGRLLFLDDGGVATCPQGACVAVSACGPGQGYLSTAHECGGASTVCCLAKAACGNQAEFDCCTATARFRPECTNGQLTCTVGTRCADADAGTDAGTFDAQDDGGTLDAGCPGSCVAVSSCLPGVGYLSSQDTCQSPSSVCCLPLTACQNEPEFDCCTASATYRPACGPDGQLMCTVGSRCETDGGSVSPGGGGLETDGGSWPTYDGGSWPAYDGGSWPTYDGGGSWPTYDGGGSWPTYDGGGWPEYDGGGWPEYDGGGWPEYDGGGWPEYDGGGWPTYDGGGWPEYDGGSWPPYDAGS